MFSKYELLFLDKANSSSDAFKILILQFPLPRTFLTISIKFNPSQLEPLFNKILITFFISFPALYYPIGPHVTANIGYAKPYTKPSQSNLLSSCIQIIMPYGSNTLPIKSWVFKSCLFFRVRRHGQQQLYFQYKVCWSFYRMVGSSINFTILFVHSTTPIICKKIVPLIQSIFTSLFLPYFITKTSLQYNSLPLHLSNFLPPNNLSKYRHW